MNKLHYRKAKVREYMDRIAGKRDYYTRKNRYYYDDLIKFLRFTVPEKSSVLEIGCGTGHLLNGLDPKRGVGIDISPEMVRIASEKHRHLEFMQMDVEALDMDGEFDFILISDTLCYLEDVQKAFQQLRKVSAPETRIIITYHNYLWTPLLSMAEFLKLKMPRIKLNWLNQTEIIDLLYLEGFDVVKKGKRLLLPVNVPVFSWFINKFVAKLPFFNSLCLTSHIVAKKTASRQDDEEPYSVSVVIPARNEKGNIEDAVKRVPRMGKHTEIVFVEGGSTDGTFEEIQRVCEKYSGRMDIKYCRQDGTGKADAVRKGFSIARGDILVILDADLTVPPEELPKFYNAFLAGKAEFANGSRLMYPMEKEAMRFLNLIGNHFFAIMFSWIMGQKITDTLCGTKAISRENYEKLIANRSYFGDFDPFGDFDLIFGAAKLNMKIVDIPIRYQARQYGTTNISRFSHGWLLLRMMFFALNKLKFL
jgi:SAM-dependent methyltransferase